MTAAFDGRYRAEARDVSDDLGDKPTETRVVDSTGKVVLTHTTPGHGWFAQDVWVTGGFLVVEEINEADTDVRVIAYDLASGERMRLPGPEATQPELDASSGSLAYISGGSASRMCVQLLDLSSLTVQQVMCARREQVLADTAYNAGAVTYSVIDRPNEKRRCKTVWVAVPGQQPRALPTRDVCKAWSGAVIAGAAAWDEADPLSEQLAFARGYIESDGGLRATEPMIATDTIVGCGSQFFWVASDHVETMSSAGRVETVWGPRENWFPTLLRCIDDRWLQLTVENLSAQNLPSELLVRDLRPD